MSDEAVKIPKALDGVGGWFVSFGHAAGQIPIRLVLGINEQDAPMRVMQITSALTRLRACLALPSAR